LATAVQAPPALAQATGTEAAVAGSVDTATQTQDVRFRDDGHDRMTVPVRVSGAGPYRFLIDTGADRTAISTQLAGKLKLPAGRSASMHTLGGVSNVATANVASLQLTRDRLHIPDAALLDREHIGADGILGVDSLRSQRVLFDFEAGTMAIVPAASREVVQDADSIVVKARRKHGRLVISEARANGIATTIVLDTGAQVSIGNPALRKRLLGDRPVDPTNQMLLLTVTGQPVTGEFVHIDRLAVGGVTIRKLAVVFTDAHTFKALNLNRKPAILLGMNAMRAFKKMSIDFASKKMRVVLPEESSLDTRLAQALPKRRI
jgi:predicted aspartyl protease